MFQLKIAIFQLKQLQTVNVRELTKYEGYQESKMYKHNWFKSESCFAFMVIYILHTMCLKIVKELNKLL